MTLQTSARESVSKASSQTGSNQRGTCFSGSGGMIAAVPPPRKAGRTSQKTSSFESSSRLQFSEPWSLLNRIAPMGLRYSARSRAKLQLRVQSRLIRKVISRELIGEGFGVDTSYELLGRGIRVPRSPLAIGLGNTARRESAHAEQCLRRRVE